MKIYDLVIIGSGPAGMSAAIYAQRAMLDFIVIEKEYMPGGQVVQTYEVDNYPGIPKTNGMDLGMKFSEHAKELGVESITAEVKEINADNEIKEIILKNGDILKTKTIILATGAVHQGDNIWTCFINDSHCCSNRTSSSCMDIRHNTDFAVSCQFIVAHRPNLLDSFFFNYFCVTDCCIYFSFDF